MDVTIDRYVASQSPRGVLSLLLTPGGLPAHVVELGLDGAWRYWPRSRSLSDAGNVPMMAYVCLAGLGLYRNGDGSARSSNLAKCCSTNKAHLRDLVTESNRPTNGVPMRWAEKS